jgi:hypothetical protein
MANYEQTFAKNYDNLLVAISIVKSLGPAFNPTNELIKLPALEAFATAVAAALEAVNEALPAQDAAVKDRIADFKPVAKRVTKILNAAKAQGFSNGFVESLTTTANRLRGMRVSAKTPDDPLTPGTDGGKQNHSSSNRSFAGILESLNRLEEQLIANKDYNPNEEEFKTAAISAWIAGLRTRNQAAIDARAPVRAVRAARDELMFNDTDGLIQRMRFLKTYVSTILETSDPRYKALKKLPFKTPT